MFKNKTSKSVLFVLVAVLMFATVVFASCGYTPFKPIDKPEKSDVISSNGGNAVRYGDYIYYVNGYQGSSSAENTYAQVEGRVGSIARIKISDIEELFGVYSSEEITGSSARTEEVARLVALNSKIVVPNFYYSGNTTTTQLNGIYIFDDRIYILTPNDELTAGGNTQTSQSVLTSYELDGSNPQRHYIFTNNAAQILLDKVGGKLVATYIMGSDIGCIDVATGAKIALIEKTTNAQFDVADKAIVYMDADGAICRLKAGDAEGKVVVASKNEDKDHAYITYTIVSVNGGYIYYTVADSNNPQSSGKMVYYATDTANEAIALATEKFDSYYGYKETFVYTKTDTVNGVSLYGIYLSGDNKGGNSKMLVDPQYNSSAITIDRLEGDILYYTCDKVAYKVNLADEDANPVAYGTGLSSASGWSVPDFIDVDGVHYVITLSSGSVTIVKFDADKLSNGDVTIYLTKVEPKTDDDK